MPEQELAAAYQKRLATILEPTAANLERAIRSQLAGLPRIDRVTARAKAADRFLEKAKKLDGDQEKYPEPLRQIQDQVGARIVTFYSSDVDRVAERISKYYSLRESKSLSPESTAEFGYFGQHFILNIPFDMFPAPFDVELMPEVYELQIKTLFQHAWAEANHDLAYKPTRKLDSDEKRLFAFTAAQAWGADKIFEDLFEKLSTVEVQKKR